MTYYVPRSRVITQFPKQMQSSRSGSMPTQQGYNTQTQQNPSSMQMFGGDVSQARSIYKLGKGVGEFARDPSGTITKWGDKITEIPTNISNFATEVGQGVGILPASGEITTTGGANYLAGGALAPTGTEMLGTAVTSAALPESVATTGGNYLIGGGLTGAEALGGTAASTTAAGGALAADAAAAGTASGGLLGAGALGALGPIGLAGGALYGAGKLFKWW